MRHFPAIALCFTVAHLALAIPVRAGTVAGITGDSQNGGTPNTLFEVDTVTGVATPVAVTPVTPNDLAFNEPNNVYYFGDHFGDDFYVLDRATGISTKIADAESDFGAPAGSRFSGPGAFHQGTYYFVPEAADGFPFANSTDIFTVTFSPNGKLVAGSSTISVMMPSGFNSFGDFGDFAVDPTTGILYGQTKDIGDPDRVDGIFSIDINSPNPQLTVLNASGLATDDNIQMAFDGTGALFGNRFDNQAEIFRIDKTNGNLGPFIPLVGTTADFFDMATVPDALSTNLIPEPGSFSLLALGAAAIACRRRRRPAAG